jgi:hypothetical protein
MTMPSLLIDLTHGEEIQPDFTGDNGLSAFKSALYSAGVIVGKISKRPDFNIDHFRAADVLMIAFPTVSFTPFEVENVINFVERGGSLFMTGEWGNIKRNAEILNELSAPFRIKFNMDRIADSVESFEEEVRLFDEVIKWDKAPHFPKITEFADHPINEGVSEIGHFSGCSLDAPDESALAWSSATSFGDIDADGELDPGEKVGHLITAAHPHTKGGRIVAYGDTSILTNKYIKVFVINTVLWLCHKR